MSFTTEDSKLILLGNGVKTVFPYNFLIYADTHLAVYLNGVRQSIGYTVDGVGGALGGNVTFAAAPAAGVVVTLNLEVPFTQELSYTQGGKFPSASHEKGLDLNTMLCRRLNEVDSRALLVPQGGDSTEDLELPSQTVRASKYLAFDASGNPVATAGTTSVLVASTFMETVLDDANAAAARTTLGAASASDLAADELILDSLKQAVRNPIINGNMEVWQRGTTGFGSSTTYSADRWTAATGSAAVVYAISRTTNVPTVAQAGVLFNYALELDITTADAALGAGEYTAILQHIEGYNWRHFAQREFTVSFWVSATKTGLHSVGFHNAGTDRGYVGTYTITAADTWEKKTITVPASPSAGTWDYTNGRGVSISFGLGAGTNHQYTSGSWQTITTGPYGTSATVNDMDSTSNFFRITGVKLELGSVATPIKYAPFEEELLRCMRYYQKSFLYATAPAQNVGQNATGYSVWTSPVGATAAIRGAGVFLPVWLRGLPIVTLYNPGAANAQMRNKTRNSNFTSTSAPSDGITERGFYVQGTSDATTAVGDNVGIHWAVDAEL